MNQTTKIYYKYVYTSDGKVQGYSTDGQENPGREARYTIEKQVANPDGSTVFYLKERWDYIPYHEEAAVAWYVLWKVSEDGKIAEHTASQKDYMPFDRYPLGIDFHCIYALK